MAKIKHNDTLERLQTIERITDKLRKRPGYLMRRCLKASAATFERACLEAGITVRQSDFLFVLSEAGELSHSSLSNILDIDPSTTTLVVGLLEKKGLVSRRPSTSDTRRKMIRMTEAGLATYRTVEIAGDVARAAMLEALSSKEAQQLVEFLDRIVTQYDHVARKASGH